MRINPEPTLRLGRNNVWPLHGAILDILWRNTTRQSDRQDAHPTTLRHLPLLAAPLGQPVRASRQRALCGLQSSAALPRVAHRREGQTPLLFTLSSTSIEREHSLLAARQVRASHDLVLRRFHCQLVGAATRQTA